MALPVSAEEDDAAVATMPAHLDPSQLGTREYWRSYYAQDLALHPQTSQEDAEASTVRRHAGQSWFASARAEQKMAKYLQTLEELSKERSSFLDLGTGNGAMLFRLRRQGWRGLMVGVDYAPESVALARSLAEDGGQATMDSDSEDNSEGNRDDAELDGAAASSHPDQSARRLKPVAFHEFDILKSSPTAIPDFPNGGFDVLLDKGTFDAISLNDEVDAQRSRVCEQYPAKIAPLLRENGLALITSCNWTADELQAWFCQCSALRESNWRFEVHGSVKYPSFRFGGQDGQAVVSLCFRKVRR